MREPQVECNHAGAVRRSSFDPEPYCSVCWQVQKWAEWIRILQDMNDVDDLRELYDAGDTDE